MILVVVVFFLSSLCCGFAFDCIFCSVFGPAFGSVFGSVPGGVLCCGLDSGFWVPFFALFWVVFLVLVCRRGRGERDERCTRVEHFGVAFERRI